MATPVDLKLKLFSPQNTARVRQGLRDYRTPPITLDIDPTRRCNSRCPRCTFPDKKPEDLPIDLAKEIISQAAQLGVRALTYTGGGEPLLHHGLGELLRHGQSLGSQNGLITNGLAFTTQKAKEVLHLLNWVRFSIDAGSARVYKNSHGQGANKFSLVWNNLRDAVSVRNKLGTATNISLSYLVFEADPPDFRLAADLAMAAKVDLLLFKPGRLLDRSLPAGTGFAIAKLAKAWQALRELKMSHPFADHIAITRFDGLLGASSSQCHGQQWTTSVGSDGKLYVCCEHKYDPRFLLGDLKTSPLKEIWESAARRLALEKLDPRAACFPGCKLAAINRTLNEKSLETLFKENEGQTALYPYFI
jgi:GTP 3',8-cyclase